jgi:hypothetical protein
MNAMNEEEARNALKCIEKDIESLDAQIAAAERTIRRAKSSIEQFAKVRDALLDEAQSILDQLDRPH